MSLVFDPESLLLTTVHLNTRLVRALKLFQTRIDHHSFVQFYLAHACKEIQHTGIGTGIGMLVDWRRVCYGALDEVSNFEREKYCSDFFMDAARILTPLSYELNKSVENYHLVQAPRIDNGEQILLNISLAVSELERAVRHSAPLCQTDPFGTVMGVVGLDSSQ